MIETVAGHACAKFGDDVLPPGLTAAEWRMTRPVMYCLWLPAITGTYPLGAHLGKNRYPDRL